MCSKRISLKGILYTLLVVFFCIADQRRGSAPGQVQFIFVNLVGVAICLMMCTAYRWKDFMKLPYFLWTVLFVIGAAFVTYYKADSILYRGQWNTALLNIWFLGLLGIRLIFRFLVEKQRPSFSIKAMIVFFAFMLLACLSINDSLWPWWYLVLFGMLYVTEFSGEDRLLLRDALLNGMILGFFIIQGLAFVFRPYDNLRYPGLYANANINALFYSLVYCAFLGKYCIYFTKGKEVKHGRLLQIVCLAFCGAMWSFVCLTMCRSAMLGMAVSTAFAGIYCLCQVKKGVIWKGFGMLLGLVVCVIVSAPICFCAVRYLPPLFHHPIWFGGEYSEAKVHSWDPIDSPKYIKWEQVLEGMLGRWEDVKVSDLFSDADNSQPIYIASVSPRSVITGLMLSQTPVLDEDSVTSVNVRLGIHKYYLERLNLWGHKNAENGLQLTEYYWAPHAHNLFLQMAFSFGIPAGLFFLIWVFGGILVLIRKAFGKEKDTGSAALLLFYIDIVVFGMLEIVWLTGQLSFTLLFLLPVFVFGNNRKKPQEELHRDSL